MTGLVLTMAVTVSLLVVGSEATCGVCNERLKLSLICCLFEGRCCLLGPVAVGKRDVSWSMRQPNLPQLPRIVHPHARPR